MKSKIFLLLIVACSLTPKAFSQYEFLQMPKAESEIQTSPTFNSCSYYLRTSCNAVLQVEYKGINENRWHPAHSTVCDQPEEIHKGSLFNLIENTDYQIRILSGNDNKVIAQTSFRTWTSTPPIAKTIDLSKLPATAQDGIVITEQGTPGGWIKYTAPKGWEVKRTAREADQQDAVIVLNEAKYIILENLTVEGGKRHSVLVNNCDHVRILNCDLSGWGRKGVQQFVNGNQSGMYMDDEGSWINYDGSVQIHKSFGTVVERCYVHDPRGRSNSWVFSHPSGPQAIVAYLTRGGNVIRWNDFIGSDEHRWNDVIEGNTNHTPDGGLFRDSDIYGNYLAFGNDDGIELEGGGINLRFMGNKIEGTLAGISLGANMVGPQYVIGNLIVNPGDEEGLTLMFIKNNHGAEQKGKRFIYNNTFHGFDRSSSAYTHYGPATPLNAGLGTMRNNIFVCNDFRTPSEWALAENFDNDLFWVNHSPAASEKFVAAFKKFGQEKNALTADPQLINPVAGNYRLSAGSPARNIAMKVSGITQAGDDLGAFFNGVTDLPARPLAFTASPAQLNFTEAGGNGTVTLSLPPDATEPVSFQINQNKVFNWFSVSPAKGKVSPGETLTLTVTVNPASISGRPVFRGVFLVRTPEGLSRPITVYAQGNYKEDKHPASAGPNTVYLKNETGIINTQIKIPDEGNYSLLVRTTRGANQRFDISMNGETINTSIQSASWYFNGDSERAVWLYSFGQLKPGSNHLIIKPNNPMSIVEYIITDKPEVFFIQERNARR